MSEYLHKRREIRTGQLVLTLMASSGLLVLQPLSANPFKKIGKLVEKVERKAATAEEIIDEAEKSIDQVERTKQGAERVARTLGMAKGQSGEVGDDVEPDTYSDAGDYSDPNGYADAGTQAGGSWQSDTSQGDSWQGSDEWAGDSADAGYGIDGFGEPWNGTFSSNYGELRLVQIGRRVYGDYAGRGYFEGCTSDDGTMLRGTFQYNSPRSSHGFIEFRMDGAGKFEGTWTWTRNGVPQPGAKVNWRGQRTPAPAPSLKYVDGSGPHFADSWTTISEEQRLWVTGGGYGSCAGSQAGGGGTYDAGGDAFATNDFSEEWGGTFKTNHGELRLVQIGRRVYGDYQNRGFFEGCTHDDGMTLRGTFQYNSPRSKHGFIEFRLDGDGFLGTWTWTGSGVPQPGATVNWRGARSNDSVPTLIHVDGGREHFADNWDAISSAQRKWVLGSEYYDSCDPPEVDYEQ